MGKPLIGCRAFPFESHAVILTRQDEADLWLEGEAIDTLKLHWPVAG